MGNFGKNQNRFSPPEISGCPAATLPGRGKAVAMDPAAGGMYPSGRRSAAVDLCKGIHINRDTLKMECDKQDPEKYVVQFTYAAYNAGIIIIRLCRSKPGDEGLIKEDLIPFIKVDSQQGRGQKFRREYRLGVDLFSYKINSRDIYMIEIQAVAYSGTIACQYTRATFDKEEHQQGEIQIKVTYQSLHLNRMTYVFHDTCGSDIDGRLLVFTREIGKGNDGTVVFEGIFEGREVAVKRIAIAKVYSDVALDDIEKLILSDQHPNIVTYYGVHHDQKFLYIALERGVCSLDDLICPAADLSVKPQPTVEVCKQLELWKAKQNPSSSLLRLMRDIVAGLAHLHELGISHLYLKPQNVLISKDTLSAQVSDMGISKLLPAGIGSSGWQVPELLGNGRQNRAADLFSFGILLFFCITRGRHPFGDDVSERDVNIKKDVKKNLDSVNHLPEAHDLICCLLHPDPESRPTAAEVYNHPLFWDPETRLSFLRDAGFHLDLEVRGFILLESLESRLLLYENWNNKIDTTLITEMELYEEYDYNSVCHLLRAIRHILDHYEETPESITCVLGSGPTEVDEYFSSRFPRLLLDVYKLWKINCVEGDLFHKYHKHGRFR